MTLVVAMLNLHLDGILTYHCVKNKTFYFFHHLAVAILNAIPS
jgi:hypothetical protein